jgi:hypothetical protein
MTEFPNFKVPLVFETDVYSNWQELKSGKQKQSLTKKLQKWCLM